VAAASDSSQQQQPVLPAHGQGQPDALTGARSALQRCSSRASRRASQLQSRPMQWRRAQYCQCPALRRGGEGDACRQVAGLAGTAECAARGATCGGAPAQLTLPLLGLPHQQMHQVGSTAAQQRCTVHWADVRLSPRGQICKW
jgi:hypothetical protein